MIALSINNWNENRKLSTVEIKILNEIKSSLEIDLVDLNSEEQSIKNKFNSENIVINWIESSEPFNDSLSNHLFGIQFAIQFRHQAAPFETLKQLGMNTIKNDSVRKQISLLYDFRYEDYNLTIKFQNDFVQNLRTLELKYFNEIGLKNHNMKPIDIIGLRQNNELLATLKTIRKYDEWLIELVIPILKEEISKAKNKIEEELKARS